MDKCFNGLSDVILTPNSSAKNVIPPLTLKMYNQCSSQACDELTYSDVRKQQHVQVCLTRIPETCNGLNERDASSARPTVLNSSSVIYVVTMKNQPIKALKINASGDPSIVNVDSGNGGQSCSTKSFNVYDDYGNTIEDVVIEEHEFSVQENGEVIVLPLMRCTSSFDSAKHKTHSGKLLLDERLRENDTSDHSSVKNVAPALQSSKIYAGSMTCVFNPEKGRYDVDDCFQPYVLCDRLNDFEIQKLSGTENLEKVYHQLNSSSCSSFCVWTNAKSVACNAVSSSRSFDNQFSVPTDTRSDALVQLDCDGQNSHNSDKGIVMLKNVCDSLVPGKLCSSQLIHKTSSASFDRATITRCGLLSSYKDNCSAVQSCVKSDIGESPSHSCSKGCAETNRTADERKSMSEFSVLHDQLFSEHGSVMVMNLPIMSSQKPFSIASRDYANAISTENSSVGPPSVKNNVILPGIVNSDLADVNNRDLGADTRGDADFRFSCEMLTIVAGGGSNVNCVSVPCDSTVVNPAGDAELVDTDRSAIKIVKHSDTTRIFDSVNILCECPSAGTENHGSNNAGIMNLSYNLPRMGAIDTSTTVACGKTLCRLQTVKTENELCEQSEKVASYESCEAGEGVNRDQESVVCEECITSESCVANWCTDVDFHDSSSVDEYSTLYESLNNKIEKLEKVEARLLIQLEELESQRSCAKSWLQPAQTSSDSLSEIHSLECCKSKLLSLENELRARSESLNKEEMALDVRKKQLEERDETLEQLRVRLGVDKDRILDTELTRQQEEIVINFELNQLNLLLGSIEREKKFREEENKRLLLRHGKVSSLMSIACENVSSKDSSVATSPSSFSKQMVETFTSSRKKLVVGNRKRQLDDSAAIKTADIHSKKKLCQSYAKKRTMSNECRSERINLFSQVKGWLCENLADLHSCN